MERAPRVGLLWRREWDPPSAEPPKLHGVFAVFRELGVEAEPVVYSDDAVEAVREQLLQLDVFSSGPIRSRRGSTARRSTPCSAKSPTRACS